ncbi:MAG TPA: MBL fold metallo-hydrolase [Anaerolineales bacterium]|nr:MBL fold metallo-hydrolase [Anaerolineales bacterium]
MEITPKVHLVPDIIANPYLIIDADGLTLIDAGLPGSHKRILSYIAGLGLIPKDLKRIILTHSDIDHIGALAALCKASGARTYASAIEAKAIAQGRPSRRIQPTQFGRRLMMSVLGTLFKAKPVQVDEILTEGQTLPVLGGLKVLETPGHTPGHISLWAPSAGVLFVGDSIVSREQGLVVSVPANTWNQDKAAESARKQAELKPNIVCSGHGPVVENAADKMPVA